MKQLKPEWTVTMRVSHKETGVVVFKSKLDALSGTLAQTIQRMIEEAESSIKSFENINPK